LHNFALLCPVIYTINDKTPFGHWQFSDQFSVTVTTCCGFPVHNQLSRDQSVISYKEEGCVEVKLNCQFNFCTCAEVTSIFADKRT